eukprot:3717514-Prymnesium_polylepis.3
MAFVSPTHPETKPVSPSAQTPVSPAEIIPTVVVGLALLADPRGVARPHVMLSTYARPVREFQPSTAARNAPRTRHISHTAAGSITSITNISLAIVPRVCSVELQDRGLGTLFLLHNDGSPLFEGPSLSLGVVNIGMCGSDDDFPLFAEDEQRC